MTGIIDSIITTDTLTRRFGRRMQDLRGRLRHQFHFEAQHRSPVWVVYECTPLEAFPEDKGTEIYWVAELTHTRMPSQKTVYLVAALRLPPADHDLLALAHHLRQDEDG